jgi:CRISP-associated protein Cas1
MQLVLHTPGLTLRVRGGAFEVLAGEERRIISPKQIESIAVTAGCLISSAAVELAVQHDLSIYFFDEIGDAVGCLRSPYFESLATLRRKQVYFDDSPAATQFVIDLFREKTEEQRAVLAYLANRRASLAIELKNISAQMEADLQNLPSGDELLSAELSRTLMGWEGGQSRRYWTAVSTALPEAWRFARRSRRPAQDPYNAATNYLYGMMYTIVEQAIFAAGLDPHLGVLHSDEYDKPTLSFDLIEPFRPWVDRLLLEQFLTGKVEIHFFEQRGSGWFLNAAGKKFFIPLFNNWLEDPCRFRGRQSSRKLQIYRAAGELARQINEHRL